MTLNYLKSNNELLFGVFFGFFLGKSRCLVFFLIVIVLYDNGIWFGIVVYFDMFYNESIFNDIRSIRLLIKHQD